MKLNGVIAVEKGVKAQVYAHLTEINKVAQKPAGFEGLTRDYQPATEDGEKLPSERKIVQYRVDDLIGSVRTEMTKLLDITAQKDLANQTARAAIVIDGKAITEPLPAVTLLSLEKMISDIRTVVGNMPERDIAEEWLWDNSSGLFRTAPVGSTRTKKEQKPIVLYPATDHHPAQTQLATYDVIAGVWQVTRQSGAMGKPEKQEILARIEKLLIAVKQAREEANMTAADIKPALGAALFEYLLAR